MRRVVKKRSYGISELVTVPAVGKFHCTVCERKVLVIEDAGHAPLCCNQFTVPVYEGPPS